MNSQSDPRSHRLRAFTRIELLVVSVLIAILILMLIPAKSRHGEGHVRRGCVNRLKILGLAYRIYATDNNDKFPWQSSFKRASNLTPADEILDYILIVTNELVSTDILACGEDIRTPAASWTNLTRTNISYFLSLGADETQPQSILAGDRNLTTNGVSPAPGRVKIPPNTAISWSAAQHQFKGNLCLSDGSVQQSTSNLLAKQWRNATAHLTNQPATLLFP